ncbi:MAG: glycosyltransferase family 39 protein [Pseudomonadales bacterium]|nr:glycosyltransferase family 39 protein [Pseudomonadales bacterium]
MIAKLFKKRWYLLSVLAILSLAVALRFYQLGNIPHGMTWDEAAIGYNGFAIFTTRRDEWLHRLPVSFQSFGDYKAPLAIYLNGPFTNVFGLNLFAVRLPFAISSILGILGMMLLADLIFEKNKYRKYLSLFAGFLLTLSPWHIFFSRAGFESGMALTFIIWGLYFSLTAVRSNFIKRLSLVLGGLCFVAALYTYHSAKVFVPVLLFEFSVLFFPLVKSNLKKILALIFGMSILLFPLIKDSFFGEGLTRAGVTIFSSNISLLEKIKYVLVSFATHLSPNFLILGETTTLRHGPGFMGVLYITTLLLVLFGAISIILNQNRSREQLLIFSIIFIGLLPAAVSLEVPHANRAILALPGFLLMAVYGFEFLLQFLEKSKSNKKFLGSKSENNIILKSVAGTFLAIHILIAITFLNKYFTQFASQSAEDFSDGYLEAFNIAEKYEKGLDGYREVDKIVFTSKYGQPYIYALFSRKTNPIWYQGGSLIKYEFNSSINIGDLIRNNALIVGSNSDELPIEKAQHLIYGSDGKMKFQIYLTEEKKE